MRVGKGGKVEMATEADIVQRAEMVAGVEVEVVAEEDWNDAGGLRSDL